MNGILSILIDIASTPALLVALIAILGNILQKKDTASIVKGGIKTFVGFLVVTAGAGVIEGSLAPFGEMFQAAFNMQALFRIMKRLLLWHLINLVRTQHLLC